LWCEQDGFVEGTWKTERSRGRATIMIESFEPLAKEDRDAWTQEGERLLRFTGAETYEFRFAEPLRIHRIS
jgi:hypothetical protein